MTVVFLMFLIARLVKVVDWWDRRRLARGKAVVGVRHSDRGTNR